MQFTCIPGNDGGIKQSFFVEVINFYHGYVLKKRLQQTREKRWKKCELKISFSLLFPVFECEAFVWHNFIRAITFNVTFIPFRSSIVTKKSSTFPRNIPPFSCESFRATQDSSLRWVERMKLKPEICRSRWVKIFDMGRLELWEKKEWEKWKMSRLRFSLGDL